MNSTSTEKTIGRRGVLTKLWIALGVVALAEFAGIVIAFLWPRKSKINKDRFGGTISAGTVDNFGLDTVTPFQKGRFYLVRLKEGGFLALSRTCTHLGCTVPWIEDEKKFICPCHSSAFDITGEVLSSPAPRPMDMYPVSIENGQVRVNTEKKIKRNRFKDSQATTV
jgi:cytochrome b6-f complex iron-sulfur subunit